MCCICLRHRCKRNFTLKMLRHILLVFVLVNWHSAKCENKTDSEILYKLQVNFRTIEDRVSKLEEEVGQLKRENTRLKTKDARSCAELQAKGFKKSGTYEIDPASTSTTIHVECDMMTGTTEISHNAEDSVDIGYCKGDGCFSQRYNYSAPMNQIEALISTSDTCGQEIKFDCNIAPLKSDLQGFNYGWWVDRHEQKKFYFDGANENLHVCGCYPNCTQSMFNATCNCDASLVPFWNSDSGKITNKRSLPIKAFFYGGFISNHQKAKITIGKLRCYGVSLGIQTGTEMSLTKPLKNLPDKDCSCSVLVSKHGYGQCKKSGWKFPDSEFCYVNTPSNCTDLVESESHPGKWASAQPCERKPDLPKTCGDGFLCKADGKCLQKSSVCDGEDDCADGSDEEDCVPELNRNDFRCNSGKIIPISWKCDGADDCSDGSDEEKCFAKITDDYW